MFLERKLINYTEMFICSLMQMNLSDQFSNKSYLEEKIARTWGKWEPE